MKTPRSGDSNGQTVLGSPAWYQTLGFRFAVFLTAALLAFDLLREPVCALTLRLLGLGSIDSTLHAVAGVVLSAIIAVAIASLLAVALSRWLTGRVSRLSRAVLEPVEDDD